MNVSQESETNLVASFHKPLPGVKDLNLTLDPETQNYRYFLIEDVENSKTDLAYDRLGNLSQASRTNPVSCPPASRPTRRASWSATTRCPR